LLDDTIGSIVVILFGKVARGRNVEEGSEGLSAIDTLFPRGNAGVGLENFSVLVDEDVHG
jgi:hypothetical protein